MGTRVTTQELELQCSNLTVQNPYTISFCVQYQAGLVKKMRQVFKLNKGISMTYSDSLDQQNR